MFKISKNIPLIVAFPPAIIGAIAMYTNGVSASISIGNLICTLVLAIISAFIINKNKWFNKSNVLLGIILFFQIALLLLTFFNSGMEGVHRWITIGPVKLYVSSIALPSVIITSWIFLQNKNKIPVLIITTIIMVILILQPDAAQLTSFAVPIIILLFTQFKSMKFKVIVSIPPLICIVYSWANLDKLAPVPYVEEIISLVSKMGFIWTILGISSLILFIIPFFIFYSRKTYLLWICLGIYYLLMLSSTGFGNFPVPFMGYGISPIIGYFIAITWLMKIDQAI